MICILFVIPAGMQPLSQQKISFNFKQSDPIGLPQLYETELVVIFFIFTVNISFIPINNLLLKMIKHWSQKLYHGYFYYFHFLYINLSGRRTP